MKRGFLLGCGFATASMVFAACSELTGPKSPETPINVTATLQAGNLVQVTWARSPQSDGVVSYNILRNGTKVGEATTLSFIDSGLGEKTTYKYTVSANCTSGLLSDPSPESAAATITTLDVTPPRIIVVNPAAGLTGVSTFATVTTTFNEAMDPATINTTTFSLKVTSSGADIPGSVAYNATTRVAEFTPSSQLPSLTSITATVTAGMKDVSGNALELTAGSPGFWSFTTSDQTPPSVIAVSPANLATGVSANAAVSVTFSEAMDASTINASNITLQLTSSGASVAGPVTYNATTHVATFTPNSPLAAPANYTFTVSGTVKDVAGNAMVNAFQSTFTTVDLTPPTVVSTVPANLATGVSTSTVISATFSKPMDPTTINTTNFTVRVTATSAVVSGTVAYNAATNTATFIPSSSLASATSYTATIHSGVTGVKDTFGNALAANFSWTFTTVDVVPPTVTATSPVNGATGVVVNAVVTATFSEAMDSASVVAAGTFTLVRVTSPSGAVAGTVTYNTATHVATFTPTAPLANSVVYTATVTTAAKDLSGNSLAVNKVFSFTTISDTTPPTITATSPVNGATGVPVSSVVTVTFSEAMDSATVVAAGTFMLDKVTAPPGPVTGTVTYNTATHVATFTPTAPLLPSTNYKATVTTAAKDLAGNALSPGTVTFTFTTAP